MNSATPTPRTAVDILRAARATNACSAYAVARADVARLSTAIGEALGDCPQAVGDDFGHFGETHLKQAYGFELDDHGERHYFADSPEEFEAKLAECEHCSEAHSLVQDRKAAKQRLGVAKRSILQVGRAITLAEQSVQS